MTRTGHQRLYVIPANAGISGTGDPGQPARAIVSAVARKRTPSSG